MVLLYVWGEMKNGWKGIAFYAFLAVFTVTAGYGIDISVRATPELTVPLGKDGTLYSLGGGGSAHATISLFNFFAPGIETGIQVQPLLNVGTSIVFLRVGGEANFYIYPIPRLFLNGGAVFGSYIGIPPEGSSEATEETSNFSGLYWGAHIDGGYRFSPAFTLCGAVGYRSYLYIPESIFSGLSFGVSARLELGALSGEDTGVTMEVIEDNPVFPILYSRYDRLPLGKIQLINEEQAEIRDVEVSFQAGDYTSRPLLLESRPLLQRGAGMDVSLHALFNEELLSFSENTKIEGEVIISYTFLDAERKVHQSKTVSIYHRNAARWEDDRIAAAFISPNDPAVLEYSKFLAGIVRERVRPDINDTLQYGMGLFEGFRLSEIAFTPDPSTPYDQTRTNSGLVDYIQYPHQTIAYKGGDRDDIGLLYTAALESIGIRTAFIPLPSEFLVAIDLGIDEKTAKSQFYFDNELIYRQDTTWIPLQVSRIKEGFMSAWVEGHKIWKEAVEGGDDVPFIPVAEAWKEYPSVGVAGESSAYPKPKDEKVINAFENSLYRYIKREVDPQAEAITGRFGPDGGGGRDFNRLGILYAMYSLLSEAKEWFQKAFDDGFRPAAINLGNVAFLQEDYEEAAEYFTKALEYRSNNRSALIGLARAKYELDIFSEADELYQEIKKIDPDLAERYSYLSSTVEGSVSRASSAADRKGNLLWDEE